MAMRDRNAKHFFNAQCLGAELKIGGYAVPHARLVFDGADIIAIHLDHVCTPG